MKKLTACLLCAALCLTLAGCRRYLPENSGKSDDPTPANAPGASVEPTVEPLTLDALNVEFSVGARDVNDLLALQKEFPDALIDALKRQSVEVGAVNVTFGTSGEATETALQSGAVDLAFLPAEEHLPYRSGMVVAVEQGAAPDLALGLIVSAVSDDAAADERFAAALRDALPRLDRVLASYAGEARYDFDAGLLEQLDRLYDTGDAVLHTVTASIGGKSLTLRGVGHRLNEYLWGIRAIEVYDGDTLVQTVSLTEADGDPAGGLLSEYSECPAPELLLRAVDANFDGYDDIEVFGWTPNNTVPYYYWLWDNEARQYGYGFRLQGPTIDADAKTLTAEYRESAAESYKDVYEWRDGELTLLSHELAG